MAKEKVSKPKVEKTTKTPKGVKAATKPVKKVVEKVEVKAKVVSKPVAKPMKVAKTEKTTTMMKAFTTPAAPKKPTKSVANAESIMKRFGQNVTDTFS